jgi:hypothetical protein
MPATATVLKTKLQLRYEKGSKTFANCTEDAGVQDLLDTADAIGTLQNKPVEKVIKIVESEIVNA